MDELVRWLGEQFDEDERIAREAGGLAWSRPEDPGDPAAIRDSERERVVYDEGWPSEGQTVHIAEWDPARVLREIDAKRRIVAAYLPPGGDPHPGLPCTDDVEGDPDGVLYAAQHPAEKGACVRHLEASKRLLHHDYVLRLLALPYADRPGFREEWRP